VGWWRLAWRLTILSLLTILVYVVILITGGAKRIAARWSGAPAPDDRWRTRIFQRWARCVTAILRMRVEVRGEPPEPPFFLVSNHLGYIDIILLASQVPCVFVAKAGISRWPVVGRLCRSVGTVFIERKAKRDIPRVMERIDALLAGGSGLIVFPEGTSSRGERVERFKPALLESPVRLGIPVSYASLWYATPAGSPPADLAICWWGGATFGPHALGVLKLPGFRAGVTFGREPIRGEERKVLAARLQSAVERLFRPVRTSEEAE
jgi:1-acyl-sn-glycerol-3-phosphate acyltransferase